MIVLDASIMIAWLLGEEPVADTVSLTTVLRDMPAIAPSHWPLEISNTLRTHLRAERLSISDFQIVVEKLASISIRIEPTMDIDEVGPLAQFALAHGLTAYDGAYVQLALQRGATLATLDRAMRRAAGTLSIPVLPLTVS